MRFTIDTTQKKIMLHEPFTTKELEQLFKMLNIDGLDGWVIDRYEELPQTPINPYPYLPSTPQTPINPYTPQPFDTLPYSPLTAPNTQPWCLTTIDSNTNSVLLDNIIDATILSVDDSTKTITSE